MSHSSRVLPETTVVVTDSGTFDRSVALRSEQQSVVWMRIVIPMLNSPKRRVASP